MIRKYTKKDRPLPEPAKKRTLIVPGNWLSYHPMRRLRPCSFASLPFGRFAHIELSFSRRTFLFCLYSALFDLYSFTIPLPRPVCNADFCSGWGVFFLCWLISPFLLPKTGFLHTPSFACRSIARGFHRSFHCSKTGKQPFAHPRRPIKAAPRGAALPR